MADSIMPRLSEFGSSLTEIQRAWITKEPSTGSIGAPKPFGHNVSGLLLSVQQQMDRGKWHVLGWNVFDILGRVRLEDAHSDVLAWLLTPWEAHGLGTKVAEALVRAKWSKSLPGGILSVKSRRAIRAGVVDIEVRGRNWWLVVENKLDAVERNGQTDKYTRDYASRGRINYNVFLVFLTPDGRAAQAGHGRRSDFRSMSYSELRDALVPLNASTESGRFMINQFIEQIMQNVEVA